jgi:hypothetical protein
MFNSTQYLSPTIRLTSPKKTKFVRMKNLDQNLIRLLVTFYNSGSKVRSLALIFSCGDTQMSFGDNEMMQSCGILNIVVCLRLQVFFGVRNQK